MGQMLIIQLGKIFVSILFFFFSEKSELLNRYVILDIPCYCTQSINIYKATKYKYI